MWIGSGGGLYVFEPATETFTRYVNDETDPHSLSDNNVIELFQDRGGVVWIGTFSGLSKFNAETVSFPKFSQSKNPGLKSNTVTSFAEGLGNDVWVGTFNGLHKWDAQTSNFSHFSRSGNGLTDDRIMALASVENSIWVGTQTSGINLNTRR